MRESENNFKTSKKLVAKAWKYYESGDFEKARNYTKHSIKKDSNNAEAHFVKGNVLLALAEPYQAIKAFNHAMELGYRDEVIYTNRGTALRKS